MIRGQAAAEPASGARSRVAQAMNFSAKKIAVLLLVMALGALAGQEAPLPSNTTPRTELVVLIAAGWSGRFAVDEHGHGGLAATFAYVQKLRAMARPEGGNVIFLHTGELSGATDIKQFQQRLHPGGLDLVRYLRLDAALAAGDELKLVDEAGLIRAKPFIRPVGSGSEKKSSQTPTGKAMPGPSEYRIVPTGAHNVLVAGLSKEAGDIESLGHLLRANRSAEMHIILLERAPSQAGPALEEGLTRLLGLAKLQNPFDALPQGRRPRVRLIAYPAGIDHSDRGSDGTLYCAISSGSLCEVRIFFEAGLVIGSAVRFVRPNTAHFAADFLKPDPVLMRAFPPSERND